MLQERWDGFDWPFSRWSRCQNSPILIGLPQRAHITWPPATIGSQRYRSRRCVVEYRCVLTIRCATFECSRVQYACRECVGRNIWPQSLHVLTRHASRNARVPSLERTERRATCARRLSPDPGGIPRAASRPCTRSKPFWPAAGTSATVPGRGHARRSPSLFLAPVEKSGRAGVTAAFRAAR